VQNHCAVRARKIWSNRCMTQNTPGGLTTSSHPALSTNGSWPVTLGDHGHDSRDSCEPARIFTDQPVRRRDRGHRAFAAIVLVLLATSPSSEVLPGELCRGPGAGAREPHRGGDTVSGGGKPPAARADFWMRGPGFSSEGWVSPVVKIRAHRRETRPRMDSVHPYPDA
jgi:hypothetical protein